MNEKFVYAVYESIEEANQAVSNLTSAGIPLSAITLYADDDVIEEVNVNDTLVELRELDDDHEKRSIWNRIADFFSMSDDEEDFPVDFSGYKDEIDDDKILVVVEKTYEGEALSVDTHVDVIDEADPNQVETFVHEDYSVEEAKEEADTVTDDSHLVAGDMGAATAVTEENLNHTEPPVPDITEEVQVTETEDIAHPHGKSVAGDTSRESEESEAYYTNIDSHRAVRKERASHQAYVADEASDAELREKRQQKSVAGDMGDYSDYAEYYQGAHNKDKSNEVKADETNKTTDTSSEGEPHHELGAFEEEMRRHEAGPPADEVGVNPEQFDRSGQ